MGSSCSSQTTASGKVGIPSGNTDPVPVSQPRHNQPGLPPSSPRTHRYSEAEAVDFVDVMREPTPRASRTNNPLSVVVDHLPDGSEAVQFSPGQWSSSSAQKSTGNWSDAATCHSSFAVGSALSLQSGSTVHSVRLETHLRALSVSGDLLSPKAAVSPLSPDGSCVAFDGSFPVQTSLPPPSAHADSNLVKTRSANTTSVELNSRGITPTNIPPLDDADQESQDELDYSSLTPIYGLQLN